jgi:DNA invertase Pin-like site-specific DNA recombinase
MGMRVGIYARVSTSEQTPANQLDALRIFGAARGWEVTEFVDHGVSGAKERRPALDELLRAVRKRKIDAVACVKLDRLARSVRHLVSLAQEFESLGVHLIVLDQAIDTTTPSGRLLFHVLASIAEFERDLIRDRVKAGMARARRAGKRLGRPHAIDGVWDQIRPLIESGALSQAAAARQLKVSRTTVWRALQETERRDVS